MEGGEDGEVVVEAEGGGAALALTPGGGPSKPGESWVHARVIHSASWECNYCKKVVAGENHTRVFI